MDLLDILFDLLGLAIAFFGKFWVLILAGLSYLLFGKKEPKRKTPTIRPVLTPTADGGYPTSPREDEIEYPVETTNPFSRSVDYMEMDSTEDHSLSSKNLNEANDLLAKTEHGEHEQGHRSDLASNEHLSLNPREAMKWSLIFAPPRSKQPYRQQLLKNK